MKYRYDFLTQTDLGKLFGVTSHEIGKWLLRIDLRNDDKTPSDKALAGNYVALLPCRNERHTYSWHTKKTVDELEKAGYQKIPNPPEYLVQHDNIVGPYICTKNNRNGYDIKSSNGDVCVTAYGKENAEIVMEAMNIYDRCVKKKMNRGKA